MLLGISKFYLKRIETSLDFLEYHRLQCIEIRHMVSIVSVQRKIGKLPKRVSYCKVLDHKIYYIICTGSDHIHLYLVAYLFWQNNLGNRIPVLKMLVQIFII